MQKTKKDLSFFAFSQVFNHQFIQKTKKTLSFFSFFKVMTKKNKKTRGKPKKNKHEPQTKHSLKSFGFLVFWFFRGFVKKTTTKKHTFKHRKKKKKIPQIAVNCEKVWVLGGGYHIYIYMYIYLFKNISGKSRNHIHIFIPSCSNPQPPFRENLTRIRSPYASNEP